MHLSTTETKTAIPLCLIKGEKRLDGEVVFIEPDNEKRSKLKLTSSTDQDLYSFVEHLKPVRQNRAVAVLNHALTTGTKPDEFLDIYEEILSSKDHSKEVDLVDGLCIPLANPDKRSNLYLFGQSGAGKSYFINMYVSQWKKLHPKKPVYLFSTLDEDESLDGLKPKRIKMDEGLLEDEIELKDFEEDSMVIFDDVFVKSKQVENEVNRIKDLLLQTGRHQNVWMVISSHLGSNYRETRLTLAESHAIVVFPNGCPKRSLDYVLEQYAGLDKDDLKKLRKLPSRWVFIRKTYPTAIVYEKGCYLLN